jgi:hypothetical protein
MDRTANPCFHPSRIRALHSHDNEWKPIGHIPVLGSRIPGIARLASSWRKRKRSTRSSNESSQKPHPRQELWQKWGECERIDEAKRIPANRLIQLPNCFESRRPSFGSFDFDHERSQNHLLSSQTLIDQHLDVYAPVFGSTRCRLVGRHGISLPHCSRCQNVSDGNVALLG